MRLIVSTILIVMILASQGVCVSHSHLGIAPGHAGTHSGLPHFHGSHAHGEHGHVHEHGHKKNDDRQTAAPAITGHSVPLSDSAAFYFADSVSSQISRSSTVAFANWSVSKLDFMAKGIADPAVNFAPHDRRGSPHQWSTARSPRYLVSLAIRC